MTAGKWTYTNQALADIENGVYDQEAAATFKVALVTSASNIGLGSTTWAGVTNEVAAAHGYPAGGNAVTMVQSGTTTKTLKGTTDTTFTASGGTIVAHWAVRYAIGGNVVAFCLLDSAGGGTTVTVPDGQFLAIDLTTNGEHVLSQA